MNKKFNKNILVHYLNEDSSSEYRDKAVKIFNTHAESSELQEYVREDWENYNNNNYNNNNYKDARLNVILHKIHHTIHLNKAKNDHKLTKRLYKWYSGAAAILLIPIMLLYLIHLYKDVLFTPNLNNLSSIKIECPLGGKMAFSLPDGTKGMLNSGSFVEYSMPFKRNRYVTISGEAYLNVYHDNKHPFTIHSNLLNVEVLGTKFNIKAYPEDKNAELVLEQGKVSCTIPHMHKKVIIHPDEKIFVDRKNVSLTEVKATDYLGWKDGKLTFRSESMKDVIKKLSRWYNVDFEVEDKEILNYSFRGTFIDDPLEEVLKLLALTSPIDYKVLKRKKSTYDNWSQKKVKLFKRKS